MLFHITMKKVSEFIVLQAPLRCYQQMGRRLTDETFQHKRGTEMRNIGRNELDIVIYRINRERIAEIFGSQLRATNNLHLMYFQDIKRQGRYYLCLTDAFISIFPRQSKNNMSTTQNATCMCFLNS